MSTLCASGKQHFDNALADMDGGAVRAVIDEGGSSEWTTTKAEEDKEVKEEHLNAAVAVVSQSVDSFPNQTTTTLTTKKCKMLVAIMARTRTTIVWKRPSR